MSDAGSLTGVDAAILVGGLGTRLRGVIGDLPKPLAAVGGRPFLHHLLDRLVSNGVRSITLCSGYRADKVRESVGHLWRGVSVNYSVEDTPLGTGGALAQARPFLHSDKVLLLNGDTWFEVDFAVLRRNVGDSKLGVSAVWAENASRYGALDFNEEGILTKIQEKSGSPASGWINGGVYLFAQSALPVDAEGGFSIEGDLIPRLARQKSVKVVPFRARFVDIGVPEDYASAADILNSVVEDQ